MDSPVIVDSYVHIALLLASASSISIRVTSLRDIREVSHVDYRNVIGQALQSLSPSVPMFLKLLTLQLYYSHLCNYSKYDVNLLLL